ncbi:MAG TPA: hypothetical protein VFN49_06745, partial [Candidatus Aquilonibacter sp.]|nr:hypothetical protein [Candidatus Aquilonibacter sp.]
TDGAAFIAAHTGAVDATSGSTSSTASGTSALGASYPNLNPDSTSIAGQANLESATVAKSVDGFTMIPGLASSYQLSGSDVEFAPAGAGASPQNFAFGIDAQLNNYCPDAGPCSPRTIWLAQSVDATANGNGWNGAFAEWRCHQQYYASLNWPQSRPLGGLKGSSYDPESPKSLEAPIYGWDTGLHICS